MKLRHLSNIAAAALIASACAPAFAGWGDALLNGVKGVAGNAGGLGGLGSGGSGGKSTPDIGNMLTNINNATREVGEDEEIGIGQQFASTLMGAKPLLDNPPLQNYVNTVGRWLAMQSERPDLPWTFAVLDTDGVNAFATPGGYVFITKGLIDHLHNESELAGVLGHEIGHVLKKHHLHAVQNNASFALLGDVVNSATKGNDQVKGVLLDMSKKLYSSGLSKGDEYEADRVGVVLAARAGYDPYGLPAVLQMLEAQNPQDGSFSLMFDTHPSPASRLEALDKLMDSRFDGLQTVPGKPIPDRLAEFAKSGGAQKK